MTGNILMTPLILVHGWAGSAESWDSVVPALRAEGFTDTVAVRLPGSPGADARLEPNIRAAAAVVTIAASRLDRPPLLVGHSMGAQVTLLVHQAMGHALAGEVVIDPAYGSDATPDENDAWAARIEAGGHAAVEKFFESAIGHRVGEADRQRVLNDAHRTSPATIASYLRSEYSQSDSIGLRAQTEVAVRLRTKPVLALHSKPAAAAYERELWPPRGSEVEVWNDHGHYLHLEDPPRFAASIAAWADTLEHLPPAVQPSPSDTISAQSTTRHPSPVRSTGAR